MTGQSTATLSRYEHVPLAVFPTSAEASRAVAHEIAALIRSRQLAKRPVVLGLATGSTPLGLYAELVRMHREEGLSFANVVTFNLDEYYPIQPSNPRSYRHFMQVHLFDHVNIPPANTHVPDGAVPISAVDAHCRDYEEQIKAAGGIDFQLLGIGRTGHIGFNEPGSPKRSRTRIVTLDSLTRRDAAGDFGGEQNTPRYAVTAGVRTILEARRIVLLAWGQHKAEIVRAAIEGPVTPQITASFLQEHDHVQFIVDRAAAGALTRYRTPWLLGALSDQDLQWDPAMMRRAIIWLSQLRKKAVLKLTDDDYNEAGLQDLLRIHGSAYDVNLAGFYQLQHTITGWPGPSGAGSPAPPAVARRTRPRPHTAGRCAGAPPEGALGRCLPKTHPCAFASSRRRRDRNGGHPVPPDREWSRGARGLPSFRSQCRFGRGPGAGPAFCSGRRGRPGGRLQPNR